MGATRRTHSFSRMILGAMGVLAVAAVIAVTASSASSGSASASPPYKKGLQLAYFTSGGDNDYQKTNLRAAVETAKQYGEHMKTYAAHFQDALQLNQIMGAINGGHLDGIVIEAINPGTVCAPVKAALKKHIVVAVTNVQACDTPYHIPYPGTAGYVGGQATSVYVKWFEGAFRANPKGGEFGVLVGPIQQGNSLRAKEAWNILKKKYPQWKLVGGFLDTGYNAGPALTKTQDLIQSHPDLKLLFSNYSGQTPGAIAALRSADKLDQVKIYDFGGTKGMFKALADGTIEQTLIMLPYEEVQRGVQMVIGRLSGLKKFGPVTVGAFHDLTKDPKLHGLSPFVSRANIPKYNKVGLPEY
jgi:ribose transport system substrate-binding protein